MAFRLHWDVARACAYVMSGACRTARFATGWQAGKAGVEPKYPGCSPCDRFMRKGNGMNLTGKTAVPAMTYANEFFGVELTLPVGFSFYDAGQMAELNKSIGDLQTDEDIIKALDSGKAFFDMAAATAGGATINVVIVHAGTPDVQALDAAAYLGCAKEGLESQLSAAGAELKVAQVGTRKIDKTGDELASMEVRFEMQGIPTYEELVCLKTDDYFMTITATAQDKAELDGILASLVRAK